MKREMTCIICPRGCTLTAEYEGAAVLSVTGNSCSRGRAYAEQEIKAPMRTLTSTVLAEDGSPVAVRTSRPIPKEKQFAVMELLKTLCVKLPVRIGDIVLRDVFGADITATENRG